ncbi:hypothetical protein QJS10_CPB11g00864 [Acorus calamus]|uniref:Uncharacterized protein n=1 Tax=Acorus calamus TaxID=4465 RepID=A0AAV9DWC5_ACOCL|nr:hypothetical protein QJS10_CPB11g00864 [Acorus calamus]
MEEMEWRQRSKALWLKSRDNNTRFFHKAASQRRRLNHIGCIQIEGERWTERADIVTHLVNHFSKSFSKDRRWRPLWRDKELLRVTLT